MAWRDGAREEPTPKPRRDRADVAALALVMWALFWTRSLVDRSRGGVMGAAGLEPATLSFEG
jgi:hypothetical protein